MSKYARCPHCHKPLSIKMSVNPYESIWLLNDEIKRQEAKELFEKQKKELTMAELNEKGLPDITVKTE